MEDLTLAVVLTAAGATASAALITGLIAIAKQLVVVGPWINADREPTIAFVLSAGARRRRGALGRRVHPGRAVRGLIGLVRVAQIAMGVHDTVKSATTGGMAR